MEKLLNLITNKTISLDKINFNNFSCSSGWVGYFYAKDLNAPSVIQETSKIIESFFKDSINDFFLLTVLAYDDEASIPEFSDSEINYYENIYNKAKNIGILVPYDDAVECFYEGDDKCLLPANIISLSFNYQDILDFCELSIAYKYNKVIGDCCFMINPILKIALYPHEDIGYGCISLSDDLSILKDFLLFSQESEMFESFIDNS